MDFENLKKLVSDRLEIYLKSTPHFLLNDLHLPEAFVGLPSEMRCYIDEHYTHDVHINNEWIWVNESSVSSVAACPPAGSAHYRPGERRMYLRSKEIEGDAHAADMPAVKLAEILIAHESIHAAMMGKLDVREPSKGFEWTNQESNVAVHESIALRFCEKLPALTEGDITKADVEKYLVYVEQLSKKTSSGIVYAKYFSDFRRVKDDELWAALTADTDTVAKVMNFGW